MHGRKPALREEINRVEMRIAVKKRIMIFALCLAAIAGMAGTISARRFPSSAKGQKTGAMSAVLTPDRGKFRIVLDGHEVGHEEFEISPSGGTWTARGTTSAQVPGGAEIKATGQLKLSADGLPIRYDWSAQVQKKATGTVDFENGTAKCAANVGSGSPILKDFKFTSPRIAVLDNNLYYQYAVLAQVYDWNAGGKQTFPVLIPQDMTPGSISVESVGQQDVENVSYETLRVSSPDLEIMLYLDPHHHLVRLEVPSSKVVIQRE